ncbi:MAG: glycoside hydrolase N-terminal domain-containing protein [Faecalibacterium sp.]|nr:glycoside hydrolase N-terminal domain-containing protein [Ruminococcus sp.]MCM1391441.1 glycoside hydrolase N-terminal domain-containing protein [Ruminococcus sp.]MCM1485244.1 glycoside hydrolase N-terminal domain-containing protein [Faecalibacterium sp.]
MKNSIKRFLGLILCGSLVCTVTACGNNNESSTKVDELFTDLSKISYSESFEELSAVKKNKTDSWRHGMVSGNGLQGFVESGSPYSDTFIFQNMHFIMPNENVRYCPETFDELETVKQAIVKGEDITDNASYDDVYRYHPGGQLRLDFDGSGAYDYVRYTDYETSQVGIYYTDKSGKWERKSFTSMADSVVITKLDSVDGNAKINTTLSFDDISTLANFGSSDEVNLKYKKLADDSASSIALVAHYPDYENSELKNGGYATLSYVVTVGGTKEKVLLEKNTDETQFCGDNNGIRITDADAVYLITASDRTHSMGTYAEFESQTSYALVDKLYNTVKAVADKYSTELGFDYDKALENHLAIYQPQFDAVTLTLGDDNTKSNESLIKTQKHSKEVNSALAQRAYYAGRYAYLCCSGYSTSRLYGMWTGEWNTGWGSKYTMDANVNLQTSSMNTGNIESSPIGYTYFILRQLPDWEENAYATHGFTDAIQAPVNSDGDKAVITETCYPYPFRYWNAGASWMLQPLYETLQCYGNIDIPLSDEFDLTALKSVLSLTEEDLTDDDIKTITDRGHLKLREDILLPLLIKSANYWSQLMTPEYYTDKDGGIHYEKGKTQLNDGETYCILPSYSPENNPSNYASPSDANCAIDIAACRDNLNMLIDISKQVMPDADTSKWQAMLDKLPPYLYDETGALKEWATTAFDENNEHRHLSHLYGVWPLFETQNDEELKAACEQAIVNRESENEASHALVHRSLICARLKDRDGLTAALAELMSSKIYYNSLMTNHHMNARSAYCTDFSIGYLGIINESLVYSNNGEIEILPALLNSGFDKGTITGIKSRTRATVDSLEWDVVKGTATVKITSDIEQDIKVSCGLSGDERTISFKAKEPQTISFNF